MRENELLTLNVEKYCREFDMCICLLIQMTIHDNLLIPHTHINAATYICFIHIILYICWHLHSFNAE